MRCLTKSCQGESDERLFCPMCGRVLDPAGLRTIEMQGFRGRFSLKDSIQRSYATGEPPG